MGDFSLDLPRTEEIKKEVEKELAPTNEDKELIDNTMKASIWILWRREENLYR